jgi:hypothetical protein
MVTVRKPEAKPAKRKKSKVTKRFDSLRFLIEAGKSIPPEELAKIPTDLAANFDHYHDGTPKQR